MAYATPEELASHLQQDLDRASAELALASAAARIDAVTRGWRFLPPEETTAALRGGSSVLRLQRPVTEIAAVSSTALGLVTDHVADTDYEMAGSELRWLGLYVWPDNLTVTYTRGMAAVPADVRDACLHLAALRYVNPTKSAGGERIDDYTAPRAAEADTERAILDDIRRAYPSRGLSVALVRA